MKNALILMTRVPIPGRTKTRLETHFTPEQCSKLHTCFIKDIYITAKAVDADVFVYFTPEKHRHKLLSILDADAVLRVQSDGGLGDRMYNAIRECLGEDYDRCLLIGTDIPAVTGDMLSNAFRLLDDNEIVIGPAFDGGYYMIGMRKAYVEVFHDTFYGVKSVFENTMQHITDLGVSCAAAEQCYDIDTFEDLKLMLELYRNDGIRLPDNTRRFLLEEGLLNDGVEGEYEAYGRSAE